MTGKEARQLTLRIAQDAPECHVTGTRRYANRNGTYTVALDVVDTRSGIPFIVPSTEDWDDRVKASRSSEAT